MAKKISRGVRNNNPGNIRYGGSKWQGLDPASRQKDSEFCVFKTPAWGIRAMAVTLITYFDKYKLTTIRQIISRWAPPVENATQAYIQAVERSTGIAASQALNLHDYNVMRPLVEAIIRHENGQGPKKTVNTWYDAAMIDEGLKMAGVVKPNKNTLASVQGAATAGAATAGAAAAVLEVVQQITPAVQQVQTVSAATDGLPTWLRVGVIVLTLAAAGAAAWALWAKRREVRAV